jgi:hypothetical protein
MFYNTTHNAKYTITTSYVSEKQALRYGGENLVEATYHLQDDGFEAHVDEFDSEMNSIGLVRTMFYPKNVVQGDFKLFMQDDEGDWYYTGISFTSYSDANQAVKGPLSNTCGNMLILETKEVPEPKI